MFSVLGGLSQPHRGSKVRTVIGLCTSLFDFGEASLSKQVHGCRVLQKVCVFIILWMFNLCNVLLSCLSPKRVCLTPQTSTGEIIESGYKGMGGVTSMQIDAVIYCFIVIQIKGMIYEWEFKRNQVACLHTILSEKHSQSCLRLPLRL